MCSNSSFSFRMSFKFLRLTLASARSQAYISGHALVILSGPQTLLQTIYVDDTDNLEAVVIDESSGKIAVCGGPDVFVYQPYGIQGETLKVRILPATARPPQDWGA